MNLTLFAVLRQRTQVTTASRRQRADADTRRSSSGGPDRARKETKMAMKKKCGELLAGDMGFTGALGHTLHACHALCNDAVSRIDVRTAQSTIRRDREMILRRISDTVRLESMP